MAARMMGARTEEDFDNPFRLPPDDQIFVIRERERQKRHEAREAVKTQRVWEKTTSASRIATRTRRGFLDDESAPRPEDMDHAQVAALRRAQSDFTGMGGRKARREKEDVKDFVAKKREMFLVQMSLDVKRAEIKKLDERSKQKEEALRKAQQLLDEDVQRFDAFLQQNDQKAHKAMKVAENTTKRKQEKTQQIKHLRTQLAVLQSELTKFREQKDECFKYKEFLVKLTPQEWKDQCAVEKVERKVRRKKAWVEEQFAASDGRMQEELRAAARESEEKALEGARGRRRPKREAEAAEVERKKELEKREEKIRGRYKTRDVFESEYEEVSSGEEMPLFFREPKQLLDVFTHLEENNLFLIQNSQDTELQLEDVTQRFDGFQRQSQAKRNKIEEDIAKLEQQIAAEKQHIEELNLKVSQKHRVSEQDQFLHELLQKTIEVNTACGHDTERDPDTLTMLAAIEAKLEEHLGALDDAERTDLGGLVNRLEREADVKRREKVKRERKEQQDRKTEERLKASLVRSQAPIHKKTGKQIMFRSAPLLRMRKVVVEDDGYEQAVQQHDVFGVWMGKDGEPNISAPSKPEQ